MIRGTHQHVLSIIPGYRFLRIVGFLSGLAAGSGCILWIQKQEILMFGNPTDSGKEMFKFVKTRLHTKDICTPFLQPLQWLLVSWDVSWVQLIPLHPPS